MSRDGQTFELPRKSSLVEDLFTTQEMRDDAKLDQQIYEAVFKALELLKRQRERNRDSR